MRRILPVLALITTMSASACGGRGDDPPARVAPAAPSASSAPAATPSPSGPSLAATDYQSEVACRLLDDATRSELAGPIDDETILAIAGHAEDSSNADIALAGEMISKRHARAVALASGGDDDQATDAEELVTAALGRLKVACIATGLIEP